MGRAGLSERDAIALSAHTFSTGLLGAGIRLGCLSHIDAQQILIEARQGGCPPCRAASAPDRRAQRLWDRGRDRRDAARQQQSQGIRQLGSGRSGRCSLLLTPTEMERLTIYHRRRACAQATGEGPAAQPPGGRRLHRRRDPGRRAGRPLGGRSHRLGATLLTTDDVMPGVAASHADDSGRGHLPRRHQAGHHPRPDPSRQAPAARRARPPGEIIADDGDIEINAGRRKATLEGGQYRRPADPDRQPLSFLRNQQGARFRPGEDASACISTFRQEPRCASSPGESKEVMLIEFGGTGELLGLNGLTEGNWRAPRPTGRKRLQRARARGFKGA